MGNGFHHSKETKRKMSEVAKGRIFTEETRQKLSDSLKNRFCGMNNSFYGKHHSEESKQKMRESHKSNPTILRGEKHPNFGKHLSEETREKISEANKGKNQSEETRRKRSDVRTGKNNHNYGKHLSRETREKISEATTGEKNHNWRGGTSFDEYEPEFNERLKNKVRSGDGFTCQLCGKTSNDLPKQRKLDVHHIDYYKKNNSMDNLIALCHSCHSKTNEKICSKEKQEYWYGLFLRIKAGNTTRSI